MEELEVNFKAFYQFCVYMCVCVLLEQKVLKRKKSSYEKERTSPTRVLVDTAANLSLKNTWAGARVLLNP